MLTERTDQFPEARRRVLGAVERTAGTTEPAPDPPVVLVVGFDGTDGSQRALDTATRILHARAGWLNIVYVAQTPATVAPNAEAAAGMSNDFDEIERELGMNVRPQFSRGEQRWRFQRRDVVHHDELISAANEVHRDQPDATPVIVVGNSAQLHLPGHSVPIALLHHSPHPVITVP